MAFIGKKIGGLQGVCLFAVLKSKVTDTLIKGVFGFFHAILDCGEAFNHSKPQLYIFPVFIKNKVHYFAGLAVIHNSIKDARKRKKHGFLHLFMTHNRLPKRRYLLPFIA